MVTALEGRDAQSQPVYRPGGKRRETPMSDWVPTTCRMCLVGCGVLVNVKDGTVLNVIGNPDSPKNRGRMCAKGKSGIMNHYNPNRVTRPLKRTNPEKGIGVDPRWQEISWEEALETICRKMQKIRDEDPRKLYVQTWGGSQEFTTWLGLLRPAFGTPYIQTGVSPTCGKTVHSIQFITAGGFHQEPDFTHCNYLIDVGTQMGVATREGFNHQVPDCAKARERGMKLVVVDPVGNNA
ncbi:MAG: molybdopterin-dependent oxidoreductase, partial [Candidatus Methylomirabilales bacterium]